MSRLGTDPQIRELVPPEGVPLRFEVAATGERLMAFLLDCFLIGLTIVVVLLGAFIASVSLSSIAVGLGILVIFLLTNFYFILFELRGQGTTFGKRVFRIRVIDRNGGALTAEAIFSRNFLRQVEILGPIAVCGSPETLWPGAPGVLRLLGAVWLVVFAIMPWLNRDRLRVGDLVAGTIVVKWPDKILLAPVRPSQESRPAERRYHFNVAQLDVYGVYELQVLEEVLRNRRRDREALLVICEKIQRKIAWESSEAVDPLEFLTDFYAAQRAQLEARMLLGERREFKKKGRLGRRS